MFEKLDGMVKHLKEHDSTLSQPNGLTLKQGEEFAPNFSVKQIKNIKAQEGCGNARRKQDKFPHHI